MKDLSIVEEAKKRFKQAQEAYETSRALAEEDTRFAMGDSDNNYQWPVEIRNTRKSGNKVCLTVNLTAQHCNQIINNIRSNRPSVKVSPVDNKADKKTAEILAGLIRNIQVSSAADDAHDIAAEHAIYGGEGYWRIITEYETPTSFDQVIKIVSCPNPAMVFIDPSAKEPDKSDAQWGFIFEDITKEQAKREHPDIDSQSWETDIDSNGWQDSETIRRAEYFYCTIVKDKTCLLSDGTTVLKSQIKDEQKPFIVKDRYTETKLWKWCKLVGGHNKPVDETEWLGAYLPIIAVVGKEINVGGEIIRKGLVRDLKDPARMVNFSYSETVQTLALQNKVPYMASIEAIEGFEDVWKSANLENQPFLPYNAYDESGNALQMPSRQPPAVMPAAQVQLLQLSTEQMRAASGQHNSNFGIKSEASSGIGIQRLKAQGEIATFHFPDNLARALRYEAKVLIDLIQKYYDTPRVVRILGIDNKEEHATLNPGMDQPYHEQETDSGDIQRIFNPQVGRYDVTVDTGPSYHTQRQEGAANLNELAARNPALMQIAGDLIMQAQDFPMADKLADRLAKTLPPNLQDQKGQPQQIPPEVQQQMQQAQMQMQQMDQVIQQLIAENQQLKQEEQAKQAQMQIDAQAKIQGAQLESQIEIEKASISAKVALQKAEIECETKKIIAQMQIEAENNIALLKEQMALHHSAMDNHSMLQADPEEPGLGDKEVS